MTRYIVRCYHDAPELHYVADSTESDNWKAQVTNAIPDRALCERYAEVLNEVESAPPIVHWRLAVDCLGQAVELLKRGLWHYKRSRVLISRLDHDGWRRRQLMKAFRSIRRRRSKLKALLKTEAMTLWDHLGYDYPAMMRSRKFWVRIAEWRLVLAQYLSAHAHQEVDNEAERQREHPDPSPRWR